MVESLDVFVRDTASDALVEIDAENAVEPLLRVLKSISEG
jgi:HEAT repeat protein